MTPEWSRPERLDTIAHDERTVTIAADEAERAAVACRFDLVAVDRLGAELTMRRDGAGILVSGRVTAAVAQTCSVTAERLDVTIDEPVLVRFVEPATGEEEVELSADALDTIEIEGGAIDLGEAAVQTMALALDPFPRGPNAGRVLKAAGVIGEDEAKPMGALAGLKALLQKE
jgi:uncharacterized metal-binding protein YceD (DUF177 family)